MVVPALNAASTLGRQLELLTSQEYDGTFEVIVVDNGSTDHTADVARAHSTSRVPVSVVHEGARGINHARNAGVRAAGAPIVLLCDADDEVHPGWVAALSSAVDDRHWAAGVLDYESLNTAHTRLLWGASPRSHNMAGPIAPLETYGCNCGFTRLLWAKVGGFDPRLSGIGGDETEMFGRALACGFEPRLEPGAVVSYRLRPGLRTMLRQRYRQGRAQARMGRLPGGAVYAPIVGPRRTIPALARLTLALPANLATPGRRYQWLGAVSRNVGRVWGWSQHRRWRPQPLSPINAS